MLLIDRRSARHVSQRRKHGGACADDQLGLRLNERWRQARKALYIGETGVQDWLESDTPSRLLQAGNELCGVKPISGTSTSDCWPLLSATEVLHEPQIHFGFAAPGYAIEDKGSRQNRT